MIRCATISAFLVLAASTASAQFLGFSGSGAVGLLEDGTTTQGWESYCFCQTPGTSLSQQAILATTFMLHRDTRSLAAAARLGVGSGLKQYISSSYAANRPDMPADATLEYRERRRTIALHADLEGRLPIGGNAFITVGPSLDYELQSTLDRTEHVLSPDTARFPDRTGVRIVGERGPGTSPPVRLGGSFGVSIMIPVSEGVNVVPHVMLNADITALSNSRPGALMFTAGSSVVFDIRNEIPPTIIVDTLELPPIAEPPPRASLDMYAIENGSVAQSARVHHELVYRKIVMPAVRAIAFDSAFDRIASSNILAGVHGFAPDSLIGLHPNEIRRRALDIIGHRLHTIPKARATLIGTYGSGERQRDGAARAQRVRDYLVAAWHVEPRRITTGSVQREGAHAVMVDGAGVVEPIIVQWLDERFHLSQIGITPTIDAPRGILSSTLQLAHAGRVLTNVPMRDSGTVPEIAIDVADAMRRGNAEPIRAELVVIDSSGTEARATDELPLVLPQVTAANVSREIITLVFDECPDSSCHAAIVDELQRTVRGTAHITVHAPSGVLSTSPRRVSTNSLVARIRRVFASQDVLVHEVMDESLDSGVLVSIDQRRE